MMLYYLTSGLIANVSLIFVLILLPVGMMLASGFLECFRGHWRKCSELADTDFIWHCGNCPHRWNGSGCKCSYFRANARRIVGKSISGSINAGYNKAFSTILDANVTTLLTAIILFWQGSGPIRGFAVTLSAGILVSMFVVLIMTRLFFNSLEMQMHLNLLRCSRFHSFAMLNSISCVRKPAAILSILLSE